MLTSTTTTATVMVIVPSWPFPIVIPWPVAPIVVSGRPLPITIPVWATFLAIIMIILLLFRHHILIPRIQHHVIVDGFLALQQILSLQILIKDQFMRHPVIRVVVFETCVGHRVMTRFAPGDIVEFTRGRELLGQRGRFFGAGDLALEGHQFCKNLKGNG